MAILKHRVLITAVLATIAVSVVFVLNKKDNAPIAEEQNLAVVEQNADKINIKDSDNDGLADWEEALWHTDPQNPDSDGDGTNDGDEIKDNRDPASGEPNDILGTPDEIMMAGLNSTQKLSREFLVDYLNLKKAGEYNEQSAASLVNSLVENGYKELDTDPKYTKTDFKIISSTGENIRNFANEFAFVFSSNAPDTENELIIFADWLERQEDSILEELDPIVEGYRKIVSESLTLALPESLSNDFVNLINSVNLLGDITQAFRKANTDIISSLPALSAYENAVGATLDSYQSLIKKIIDSGEQFTPQDPAYALIISI